MVETTQLQLPGSKNHWARRVAPGRFRGAGHTWGECNRSAGGGGPCFPARPPPASGAGIRLRPLPASWLLAASSRSLPGLERESSPGSGALIFKDLSIIISRRSKHFRATRVCHGIHFPTAGCPSASAPALCGRTTGWAPKAPPSVKSGLK